jgi:ATP-dependent Clp protease adapter protein ClpS
MQVNDFARKNEMPLKCVMEKEWLATSFTRS